MRPGAQLTRSRSPAFAQVKFAIAFFGARHHRMLAR